MAGGQKPAANRMTQQQFKAKKVGAAKGHGLLKKKRDALKSRFQKMLREIVACKMEVARGMNDAAFSLARASYAGGDVATMVLERVKRPSVTMNLAADNVAGVYLPVFKCAVDNTADADMQQIGLAAGGQVIQNCREIHLRMVKLLIKMASLQTSFVTLDEEIKMTSRRVNALEYVVLPRIEEVLSYITSEMDEEAREEFFRVKKVVEKKKQKIEKEKAEQEALALASSNKKSGAPQVAHGITFVKPNAQSWDKVESALNEKDEDVIF